MTKFSVTCFLHEDTGKPYTKDNKSANNKTLFILATLFLFFFRNMNVVDIYIFALSNCQIGASSIFDIEGLKKFICS